MEVMYSLITIRSPNWRLLPSICKWSCEVNVKSEAEHRMFLKRIEKPTFEVPFENGLIFSTDTIWPISYITFSLSFTIHKLSVRLIYEAYFIFGEFSDDRKLISSALVLHFLLWPNLKAGRAEIAWIFP